MVQGYDQSFSQAATFADNAPEQLMTAGAEGFAPMGELKTGGVRQIFEVKSNAKVLARYSHGEPAIVQMPVGKGTIYYSGSLLEEWAMRACWRLSFARQESHGHSAYERLETAT